MRGAIGTLCVLAALGSATAQDVAPIHEGTVQGEWALRESYSVVETRRNRAIEAATDDMSIFTRGIARRRLRRGTPIHRSLVFRGEGEHFRAHVGDYHLDFAADGRRRPFVDPFDEEMRASQRFNGRRLTQVMRNDDATLTHTLTLSDDGSRLTLTVRIESHHLPGDVIYRAHYRRA
ncbi:MAG: hypothetical protein AAGE52_09595 [Myxococcota bacterium]